MCLDSNGRHVGNTAIRFPPTAILALSFERAVALLSGLSCGLGRSLTSFPIPYSPAPPPAHKPRLSASTDLAPALRVTIKPTNLHKKLISSGFSIDTSGIQEGA